jgi:hypothetical protein
LRELALAQASEDGRNQYPTRFPSALLFIDRPSRDMTMLGNNPWPHLLVDDFLPDEVLTQALAEIGSERYEYDIELRGRGRIEYSLLKSKTMWRAIYSRRMVELLSVAFGVDVSLNKHNMLQLRRMNDLTPEFPIHNDAASDADTIVSFLYLSRGWSDDSGGRLHLYESKEQTEPSVSIAPLSNRLVAFRTNAAHWHSVERVKGWERLSVLALWDVSESTSLQISTK